MVKDMIWVERDGTGTLVSKLTRTQIGFILLMMERNPGWRSPFKPRLELELRIRDINGRTD